jgi:hypothetical protein
MPCIKSMLMHSKAISKVNPLLGLVIKLYLIENHSKEFKNQQSFIQDVENEKLKLNIPKEKRIDEILTYDEFSKFLSKILESVNKEEKSGQVSLYTAATYRLIADVISIIRIWKPLEVEEEWAKISNFLILNFSFLKGNFVNIRL